MCGIEKWNEEKRINYHKSMCDIENYELKKREIIIRACVILKKKEIIVRACVELINELEKSNIIRRACVELKMDWRKEMKW